MRCIDPILLSFGDIENIEGLGGTLSGLAGTLAGLGGTLAGLGGIFSEEEFTSKGETESAARTKLFNSQKRINNQPCKLGKNKICNYELI